MFGKLTIKARFRMGTAFILLLFCAGVSVGMYHYLKMVVTRNIYRETEIFIGTANATRTYVKDVLRPRMAALLPAGGFIPHAMSTTFVGREIMDRLRLRFPDFRYKRAALNPMNPLNQADHFEKEMVQWFQAHPDTREWKGVIQKSSRSFYARLRAIYAEPECLQCHGDPADAPQAVRDLYGATGGYGYQTGAVVAADTIYIPVDVSFVRIKEAAWMVFLIGTLSLFTLVGLFYLLFNRTVVSELKDLLIRFQRIGRRDAVSEELPRVIGGDEVEQLKAAFGKVAADLKQAHDELAASETKFRMLFESSQDAILMFDDRTGVIDINRAGIRLFGFSDAAEALSVETFYQLFWDARDAENFDRTVRGKGYVKGLELPMVDRQGRKLLVMISASMRSDESGGFVGIDGIFRDVTEKRKMEKHLAQTEKLASIGELASGVAHEINNPLGVIQCYANLIAKGAGDDSELTNDIGIIRKHTDQCKSVVESLLNFSRVSEPNKTHTRIDQCCSEVLAILDHQMSKSGIMVKQSHAPDLPAVTADPQMIKQVLMNLLINAMQAMPDGGAIHLETACGHDTGWISVRIADTGCGISEKFIDRIFDPFFTTKGVDKGTGLGLSVSYGIIRQHGGRIEVESVPGEGTTFTIQLPIAGI